MMNAIGCIKQFAEKHHGKVCRAYLKETRRKLSILQRHPVWHRRCHWIVVVFKNWSDRNLYSPITR